MKHTFSPICLFARRISHKYILVNYLEKLWPDLGSLVTKSGHFNALHPDSVVQDGLFFFFYNSSYKFHPILAILMLYVAYLT